MCLCDGRHAFDNSAFHKICNETSDARYKKKRIYLIYFNFFLCINTANIDLLSLHMCM